MLGSSTISSLLPKLLLQFFLLKCVLGLRLPLLHQFVNLSFFLGALLELCRHLVKVFVWSWVDKPFLSIFFAFEKVVSYGCVSRRAHQAIFMFMKRASSTISFLKSLNWFFVLLELSRKEPDFFVANDLCNIILIVLLEKEAFVKLEVLSKVYGLPLR